MNRILLDWHLCELWNSCQSRRKLPVALLAVAIAALLMGADSLFAGIDEVRATDREIVIKLSEDLKKSPCTIHAIPVYNPNITITNTPVVWSGVPAPGEIRIPRYIDDRDRLYRRFQLVRDGKPIGPSIHVTDLSAIDRPAAPLPDPDSKKGLQCIVDIDDAIALGVRHTAVNVSMPRLLAGGNQSSLEQTVDGVSIAINANYVAALDETIRRMTDAGMSVNLILLNYLPAPGTPATPLVDPRSVRGTPQGIGGFHVDTAEALRLYRGLIEFLAKRYSRPDQQYGTVSGYIVGNEAQSHYAWYNLGEINLDSLVSNYARALRVADLAVRRNHPAARVFVSMDHNWTRRHFTDPKRSVPGQTFLDALNSHIKKHGNFPWGVAFHPYPEDLFDPRTWDDETAVFDFDSPRITFKNLEVLTTYLKQPRFLYHEKLRPIILSEQGFHCRDSPDGERLQAAAYVYAWQRVRRMPGIDAFIYHRHVDHAGEGGLRLGLRANRPGTVSAPGKTRRIYDVFRQIDTPAGEEVSDFALDVIGLESWNKLGPHAVRR